MSDEMLIEPDQPTPAPVTDWKSLEINELAAALAKAQGEIGHAAKDSDNPFFRSKYADLASVRSAVRDPLSRHDLSYVQLPIPDPLVARISTVLMHKSGQWIRSEVAFRPVQQKPKNAGDGWQPTPHWRPDPQAMKSAMTYARRVGLEGITGVAPDDDDDGNAASGRREDSRPVTKESLAKEAPAPRGNGSQPISEKQVNRLWAVAKAAGREKGDVVDYLKSLGYGSSSEITRDKYDEIIAWVELEGEEGIV